MLAAQGIIGKADADAIRKGLKTIGREIKKANFPSGASSRTST